METGIQKEKILVIGYGGIGQEIVRLLCENGYKNDQISIISDHITPELSEDLTKNGIKVHNRDEAIKTIGEFKPTIIFDVSNPENTQEILGKIENTLPDKKKAISPFKYIAITPDPERKIQAIINRITKQYGYEETGISITRTDKTTTSFSHMMEFLKSHISDVENEKSDIISITLSDSHRSNKELFTNGGINNLAESVNWDEVKSISFKQVNDTEQISSNGISRDLFRSEVKRLKNEYQQLKKEKEELTKIALITITFKNDKKLIIETDRTIPDEKFEERTGYRSVNSVIIEDELDAIVYKANISRRDIAKATIKLGDISL